MQIDFPPWDIIITGEFFRLSASCYSIMADVLCSEELYKIVLHLEHMQHYITTGVFLTNLRIYTKTIVSGQGIVKYIPYQKFELKNWIFK